MITTYGSLLLCSYLSVLLSSRVYSNKTQTFINPLGYKEHVIYFIVFYFGGGVKIIYWLANMKPYVLGMMKSYEDTIIYYLGNFSTTDLLFNIAQCWYARAFKKRNKLRTNYGSLLLCTGLSVLLFSWVCSNKTQQERK